ncbi:MAG: HDOD domain-containing protein [Fimbriimonadaceae bacterium]|nr:HDOD domain-containing protein [Fimbriimonadaceae bacterium]
MNTREDIVAGIAQIPALPSAAGTALQVLRQPSVDLDKLCRVVECDPALTANLLRLANSAYFGFPRRIASVRQAALQFGSRQVSRLVVTCAVAPRAQRSVRGYDLGPGALWIHSLGVAIGAVELANALGIDVPDMLFVAGLLADIGKTVLGDFLETDVEPICELAFDEGLAFDDAERQVLGIDHAEVGALLLDHWNLPADIVEVARWHHHPDQSRTQWTATHLVHAADALCMAVGLGNGRDGLHYRVCDRIMETFDLPAEKADAVICAIEQQTGEASGLFSSVAN